MDRMQSFHGIPTLRLRAREEAELQGFTYASFFRRCAEVGLIHDAALRKIWNGTMTGLGFTTQAKLAVALQADGWPAQSVIGDPGDGRVYLFWWEPPTQPYLTPEELADEQEGDDHGEDKPIS